jgi:hypothetical protein
MNLIEIRLGSGNIVSKCNVNVGYKSLIPFKRIKQCWQKDSIESPLELRSVKAWVEVQNRQ